MKKICSSLIVLATILFSFPHFALAAGVSASGGGKITVGQTFTVNVVASGAEFNAFQGTIATSGPVSVVSTTAGSANWMSQPSANGSFSGALLGQKVSSFTIATIKLKANSVGSGAVTVSGVTLKNGASTVGSSGGAASFSIEKAPELPGAVKVSSSTHPDPATAYEATTIALSWNKESGVDNFSYLLDQAEKTTPPAKATNAETSISYADKAIGTYYFHIRAHKPDGWGTTTHFKINIKEPDAKIDATLPKPNEIEIEKTSDFINDIATGQVTGLKISGKTEAGFTANLALTPTPIVPEGKTLSALADENGDFTVVLDYPISAGFHKLTIQGAKEKILTPVSDEITFEISQKQGGSINILTTQDAEQIKQEVKAAENSEPKKEAFWKVSGLLFYVIITLFVISLAVIAFVIYRRKKVEQSELKNIIRKK